MLDVTAFIYFSPRLLPSFLPRINTNSLAGRNLAIVVRVRSLRGSLIGSNRATCTELEMSGFTCGGRGVFKRREKVVISGRVGAQTRVRWWREEILLADSFEQELQSPERITLYSNGSLRVLQVQREDSGEYVCQAIRPSPWGHVTQVHEIEVMCEYHYRRCMISRQMSFPCTNVPTGILYIQSPRGEKR